MKLGKSFLLLAMAMLMAMIMMTDSHCVVNATQEDISLDEFEKLINKALRKDCPLLKKSVQDGRNICQRELGDMLQSAGSASKSTSVDFSLIRSGYGYSAVDHEIKLQVLESANASILDPPIVETKDMQFRKVRDFYNHVYKMNSTNHVAVLYSDTLENAKHTFNTLFKSKTDIHAVDTKYLHYSVKTTKQLKFTSVFESIYNKLPKTYKAQIYERVLNVFGEQVMMSAVYGGLVGQTNIIKACYSSEKAIAYSKASLQKIITGTSSVDIPNLFLKYSKIVSSDVIGGNPEISNIKKRVATFPKNSSPIKFKTVPIWELMPLDSYQRVHLKTAYDSLLVKSAAKFEKLIYDIENMKLKQTSASIAAKLFYTQSACGYDFSGKRCDGSHGHMFCAKNRKQRHGCTGLVNKNNDIHIKRGESKVIDKLCGVAHRDGIFPIQVYGCPFSAIRLFALRNANDELQVQVVHSTVDESLQIQEEIMYTSPYQKQGGCISVLGKDFGGQYSTLMSGVKWRLCSGCSPMIGKDNSLTCGCPYLV